MKIVILCGGSGTRLWPLSRQAFPKQFLKLGSDLSFFQRTLLRFHDYVKEDDIVIVSNEDYKFLIYNQLKEINFKSANYVFEPSSKNTGPAIALAMKYLLEEKNVNEDEIIFVTPSDHVMIPEYEFANQLPIAEEFAQKGFIVTFGITPSKPSTAYGYIKRGELIEKNIFKVEKFVEKPDVATAKQYLKEKEYFWNSGMFVFSIKTMFEELKKHCPIIHSVLENRTFTEVYYNFSEMPNKSIDYAVMEYTAKALVLPLNLKWSDIGSWDSVYDFLVKDKQKNVKIGDVVTTDTTSSLIYAKNRLIATAGLKNLLIVETDDAILITKRGDSEKVKEIVNTLKSEEDYKNLVEIHTEVNRPWGAYRILEIGERYKIKKITVLPGEKLSLQLHHHRSEHWVVVKGTAKVTINEKTFFVHENESIYVPKSTKHRLENPGKIPLEIIEIQVGEYVDEDDIKRFDDDYGRD